MRLMTLEVIGITLFQHRGLFADRHLQSSTQNNSALLALVRYRVFAGTRAWLITLLNQLNRAVGEIRADLPRRPRR